MIPLKQAFSSSVGKKLITAVTGVGLVVYLVLHLIGNLTLFQPQGHMFNHYAAQLHSYGLVLLAAELGLFAVVIIHAVNGIRLKKNHLDARGSVGYRKSVTKGGPSLSNFSSRTMIISGLLLLLFMVVHVRQFRFGPGVPEGYLVQDKGEEIRDLYRLAVEVFSNPLTVGFYVVSMFFLGSHLKHGVWSMFQSLGMVSNRNTCAIRAFGILFSIVWSVGFVAIPIWMYFHASGGAQ